MDLRAKFSEKLQKRVSQRKANSSYILKSEYEKIISDLKRVKAGGNKESKDYSLLRQFDLKTIGNIDKLVKNSTDIAFISTDEVFDIIHTTHIQLGHGGRNVLEDALKKRYVNLTRDLIMDYLELCEECAKKRNITSKHVVTKPIVSSEMNSRCQVDLIDMQSQADRDYRFIMVYQDHLTKFVQLRPLRTKKAEETAYQLKLIFSIFGAPHILHTDNDREFENAVVKELLTLWPGSKLVHGKPRHSQSQGSVERANQDVENKLKCWMADNKTAKWSDGLPFVQFSKNRCLHSGIGRSPYKAMFGIEPRLGIEDTMLPADVIDQIETEDDLKHALAGRKEDLEERQEEQGHSSAVDENETEVSEPAEDDFGITCVVCETICSAEELCRKCMLPCHKDCGTNIDHETGDEVTCRRCLQELSVSEERRGAKRGLEAQAEKMKQASDKRFKSGEIGENVRIPIPEVDRGRTDHRNLIGVILEVTDNFYKIGTKHGVIQSLYTRGQFDLCPAVYLTKEDVPQEEISLRQCAIRSSVGTGQGFVKCNCDGKCDTNRCSCHRKSQLCNSKCHGARACTNK